MDTEKIEDLLTQLVDKQDELISRIESLESTVQEQLFEVNSGISNLVHSSSQIEAELNWWGENPSLAKQILDRLTGIEDAA